MRRYETIAILKPSLGEEDNQAVIDRATAIIEDFNGSMVRIDKWGLRKLAYLIKKESQGYYIYMTYAGMPAGVDEMERVFRIDDRVMKFLTVKLQEVFKPLPEDEEEGKPAETPSEAKAAASTEERQTPAGETAPAEKATPEVAEEIAVEAGTAVEETAEGAEEIVDKAGAAVEETAEGAEEIVDETGTAEEKTAEGADMVSEEAVVAKEE